jgi:hypothetical protein
MRQETGDTKMDFTAIINKDGTIITEVVDRGEHLCSDVLKITSAVGRQISDVEIGPEGDKVHEIER